MSTCHLQSMMWFNEEQHQLERGQRRDWSRKKKEGEGPGIRVLESKTQLILLGLDRDDPYGLHCTVPYCSITVHGTFVLVNTYPFVFSSLPLSMTCFIFMVTLSPILCMLLAMSTSIVEIST